MISLLDGHNEIVDEPILLNSWCVQKVSQRTSLTIINMLTLMCQPISEIKIGRLGCQRHEVSFDTKLGISFLKEPFGLLWSLRIATGLQCFFHNGAGVGWEGDRSTG